MSGERWESFIDRSERPMLGLAALAVLLYLLDLEGVWGSLGVRRPYLVVSLIIDLVFVADLVLKMAVQRGRYIGSAWFVVDLVCALPVLANLAAVPKALQGLRFVRVFRMLRALRMLRVLRSLRVLRFLATTGERTREQQTYQRVLTLAVVVYAVGFVGLVQWGRAGVPVGPVLEVNGVPVGDTAELVVRKPNGTTEVVTLPAAGVYARGGEVERNLVIGSLLGMLLVLVVARYQIPALWSRQVRALLNVALPAQVAQHFLDHPDAYDHDVRAPATILFCDIKGFTSTVEALGLDDVKHHLERALDVIVDAHLAQDLIIDKFIGDAVMSFRGGNLVDGDPEDHAYRVVRGALDGILALASLGDPYFHTLKAGGASATDALIGTFGTSKRLSYTILGDRVNLAARLEGSCNAVGVRTLFCGRTRGLVGDRDDLVWRRVGRLSVQGKDETTEAWEVFDAEEDTSFVVPFHAALDHYESGRFSEALEGFESLASAGDGPSGVYAGLCRELLASGVPAGWEPLLVTRK